MSMYTGKYDFADRISSYNSLEEALKKTKIYAFGHDLVPLAMKEPKDLVAYYPYLIGIAIGNKEGYQAIHLSSESYIDTSERERLEWVLRDAKKYYRKCKRKKEEFNIDDCLKNICFFDQKDYKRQVVERVAKDGEKADVDGIHIPMFDYGRRIWYKDLVEVGWDKMQAGMWVFGLSRWFKEGKELLKEDGLVD